jgi:hypothetical protein
MLKLENDFDCLYERQVSFSCMSFHIWHRNANLESKINSGVYGHLRYAMT